jgi:hypothetical protein
MVFIISDLLFRKPSFENQIHARLSGGNVTIYSVDYVIGRFEMDHKAQALHPTWVYGSAPCLTSYLSMLNLCVRACTM